MNQKPVLNIALIGEGKNDVGIMGEKSWQDGTLQAYVERFLGDDFTINFEVLRISRAEIKGIRTLKGGRYRKYRIRGVAKKLYRFVEKHQNSHFDLLVFFSDTDKTQGQKASEKEAKAKYQSVLSNIEDGKQLLNDILPEMKFVPMIPVRILECWLLGDNDGFENIGCSPQNPNLPKEPELIWGDKHDIESNYPKNYLKRILENGGFTNETTTYRNIVFNNNFQNLYKNCPISFPLFYNIMNRTKEEFKSKFNK